ncbi:monovalent cation/H(+) antiporter subunit G [Fusibacter sp. JL298sf-3]
MHILIGDILIGASLIFVLIGVIGIYRFKQFYTRALVASNIDTVGYLTLLLGIVIRKGWGFFSLKVLLILVITLVVNPLVTHAIVRSAYISGYKIGKE